MHVLSHDLFCCKPGTLGDGTGNKSQCNGLLDQKLHFSVVWGTHHDPMAKTLGINPRRLRYLYN